MCWVKTNSNNPCNNPHIEHKNILQNTKVCMSVRERERKCVCVCVCACNMILTPPTPSLLAETTNIPTMSPSLFPQHQYTPPYDTLGHTIYCI